MTDPLIHERLAQPLDDTSGLTADQEQVLRHFTVAVNVIEGVAPEYLDLRARLLDEGPNAALHDVALELAGLAAAVVKGARAGQYATLRELRRSELNPLPVLDTLDELMHSLMLLTDPEDIEFALTPQGLQARLDMPDVRRWLSPDG
jgi:hypothetical protein